MTENSKIWKDLLPTDPKYVRRIPARPGMPANTFSAIDPTWRMMRLTEYFGPIGEGWGVAEDPKTTIVDAGEATLIFMHVKCFWRHPDTREIHYIWGFGGDSVTKKRAGEGARGDDEALKKCFTDALMNAYMRLGLSADIWLNLHADSKYIANVREFFENTRAIQQQLDEKEPPKPELKPDQPKTFK